MNDNTYTLYNLTPYYDSCNNYKRTLKHYLRKNPTKKEYIYILLGHYYMSKNYHKTHKYYKKSIKLGNVDAMFYLGSYYKNYAMKCFYNDEYDNHKKNCKRMKKYLTMAIDNGCINAMCMFGEFYGETEDFDQMLKFYNDAANMGNVRAHYYLGNYYKHQNDYDKMVKHYNVVIEHPKYEAMTLSATLELSYHYKEYHNKHREYYTKIVRCVRKMINTLFKYDGILDSMENFVKNNNMLMFVDKMCDDGLISLWDKYNSIEIDLMYLARNDDMFNILKRLMINIDVKKYRIPHITELLRTINDELFY